MKLIFEGGENYLIGAEDGMTMSKDQFYVTRIAVPKQIPDDQKSEYIMHFLEIFNLVV